MGGDPLSPPPRFRHPLGWPPPPDPEGRPASLTTLSVRPDSTIPFAWRARPHCMSYLALPPSPRQQAGPAGGSSGGGPRRWRRGVGRGGGVRQSAREWEGGRGLRPPGALARHRCGTPDRAGGRAPLLDGPVALTAAGESQAGHGCGRVAERGGPPPAFYAPTAGVAAGGGPPPGRGERGKPPHTHPPTGPSSGRARDNGGTAVATRRVRQRPKAWGMGPIPDPLSGIPSPCLDISAPPTRPVPRFSLVRKYQYSLLTPPATAGAESGERPPPGASLSRAPAPSPASRPRERPADRAAR